MRLRMVHPTSTASGAILPQAKQRVWTEGGSFPSAISRHALSKSDDDLDFEPVGSENDPEDDNNHQVIYSDSHSDENLVIVSRIDMLMQDSEIADDASEVVEREDALYSSPNGLPITTHGRDVVRDRNGQTAKL